MQLLLLLDQPDHLLRPVAEVLRCLRELEQAAQWRRVEVVGGCAQHPQLEASCISSRRASRWRTSAARPWSRSTSAEWARPIAASETFFVSTGTSTARSRSETLLAMFSIAEMTWSTDAISSGLGGDRELLDAPQRWPARTAVAAAPSRILDCSTPILGLAIRAIRAITLPDGPNG